MSERVTLSTGHEMELPAELSATAIGAVFDADRPAVSALLPAGLEPVGLTASRAAVTLLAVSYDRVGDDAMTPYDELAVILPAAPPGHRTLPVASLLTAPHSGYVWWMPVTTEPARAFGDEVWGYPKVVADITVTESGRRRTATVDADGERVLSLSVDRPRALPAVLPGYTYTVMDDTLLREETSLRGRLGVRPFDGDVSLELGDHPRADRLRHLDLSDRALLSLAGDCEFTISPGKSVR